MPSFLEFLMVSEYFFPCLITMQALMKPCDFFYSTSLINFILIMSIKWTKALIMLDKCL